MKKLIGAICSGVVGILTFVFLSISYITFKISALGGTTSEGFSAWNMFDSVSSSVKSFGFWKVCTIILIVMASLLIITCLLSVLKNCKVLKLNINTRTLNIVVLTVYMIVMIAEMIALFVLSGDLSYKLAGTEFVYSPAIGAWLSLAVGLVGCVIAYCTGKKSK